MNNPWLGLSSTNPYILDIDRKYVDDHNKKVRPEHCIVLNSMPEPFIGDPSSAKLVLLLLNPGHKDTDPKNHARPEIKKVMLNNLRRESQQHPFYPLGPTFNGTASADWWKRCLRELRDVISDETLSKKLLAIEWFPYHSEKAALNPKRVCQSQSYTFSIAKEMMNKNDVIVVGLRSRRFWNEVDNDFGKIPYLKNPRNPSLSKRNMGPELFDRVVDLLKDDV